MVDRTPYERKIAVINEAYAPSEDVAAIRSVDLIDDSRHPDYPDDILVIFLKDDYKPEGCWVRSMEVEEGRCIGKLLNEPDQDYGVHENDLIPFDIVKKERITSALAVLRGIIETVQHDKTIQPPCRLGTTVSVASGDTFSFRSKVNTP